MNILKNEMILVAEIAKCKIIGSERRAYLNVGKVLFQNTVQQSPWKRDPSTAKI